jgi:serine/threonine protein kinase
MLQLQRFSVPKFHGFCLPDAIDKETRPALLIMEYLRNGNLHSLLERKKSGDNTPELCPTNIMKIIFGIAATMAQIHKHKIIHRDLKPENVFLDDNCEPLVADFGLSRTSQPTAARFSVGIGSPMFMAPEIYNDENQGYTSAVDVWSYGVLVYDIFARDIVFEDGHQIANAQQMLLRIARGARFKRVPEIPGALWGLMEDCWQAAPQKRPSFEAIVDLLKTNDDYVIPGTDLGKYREYQERILRVEEPKEVPREERMEREVVRIEIGAENAPRRVGSDTPVRGVRFSFPRRASST